MNPSDYAALTPSEAIELQKRLAKKLRIEPLRLDSVKYIAALDVSYSRRSSCSYAAAVLWDISKGKVVKTSTSHMSTSFPYVPGLLAFREIPPLAEAISRLPEFDLLLCDGHGITHPRGFGLASHLGVLYSKPSVGLAKKPLTGVYKEPPVEPGSFTPMLINGKTCGYALRTRKNVRPVFVSPGHLSDPDSALALVLKLTGKYRLPDPLRIAHSLTVQLRKSLE